MATLAGQGGLPQPLVKEAPMPRSKSWRYCWQCGRHYWIAWPKKTVSQATCPVCKGPTVDPIRRP